MLVACFQMSAAAATEYAPDVGVTDVLYASASDKAEWVTLDRASHRIGKSSRHCHEDAAEEAARQAPDHAAQRDREPVDAVAQPHRAGAKIGI